ncbi:MAG: ABC transporter permease [Chloroflexi bacterium]|nr:ABC transporter permease [Chloroflexota bacterium]
MTYLVRQVITTVIVILGVSTVVFFAVRLSGDPAALLAPQGATADDIRELRRRLGLEEPLPQQYVAFLSHALTGDFGTSLRYQQPASELVLGALPITLTLTVSALGLALLVAVPAGIISAIKRDSLFDGAAMLITLVGQAMPVFWLSIMFILLFAVRLRVLPTGGWGAPNQVILPALALGAYSMARISRLVRSGMLEVLSQDYIRTARAKGLLERSVILLHALKNAQIPVVTVVGLEFSVLMGGAVITETIFSIPGLGRLAVSSVATRDYAVVQAAVFFAALIVTSVNFVVDLLYAALDPRIRLR